MYIYIRIHCIPAHRHVCMPLHKLIVCLSACAASRWIHCYDMSMKQMIV